MLYVIVVFALAALQGYSQDYKINERTRLYTEELPGDSLVLKADNSFAIPISLKLNLELLNLNADAGSDVTVILRPHASGQVVARFKKIDPDKEYKCLYHWRIVLGDISRLPDQHVLYKYPFGDTESYVVSQGPGGEFSHQSSFAYDFVMPVGSAVVAARDGVVAFVDVTSDAGGPDEKYLDKANVISILHSDGTIANYVHMSKDGALVKEGDFIQRGQLIGLSGNTGFSTGAHLHFEVVQPTFEGNTKKWINFEWEQPIYTVGESTPATNSAAGSGTL